MHILNHRYFQFSLIILAIYLLPLVYFGEDAYILIHDNLDSNVVWYKTLVEGNLLFSDNYAKIAMFMDAPRVSFGNELNVIMWLYTFFEPYTAYMINKIMMHIIAFFGMFILLNRYIFEEQNEQKYSLLVALLFSLLPFWPSAGLSISGLPLITYVFLNIRNGIEAKKEWFIIILFPFYSSFVLSMMFYIVFIGLLYLWDMFRKKITLKFTIAICIFTLLYLGINYRLFEVFIFNSSFMSHRIERVSEYYGFIEALVISLKHFIFGQYHAHSVHIIFLPFIFIIFSLNLISKNRDKLLVMLFILNIFISLWYGFWNYAGWASLKESISLFNSLNLSRFHFLTPLLWYVLLALALKYYIRNYKFNVLIVIFLFSTSISVLFFKSHFINEYRTNNITYKQFYAENLFHKIDLKINKEKREYKVVSIGLHPAVARYNGFYTIDGYLANYPLEHKKEFRSIIEVELEKNTKLKKNFDTWGNRCYVYVDDIGYDFIRKKDEVFSISPQLNTDTLYQMGGRYIFSTYPMTNAVENNLLLIDLFKDKDSAWDIYVYEIRNN